MEIIPVSLHNIFFSSFIVLLHIKTKLDEDRICNGCMELTIIFIQP